MLCKGNGSVDISIVDSSGNLIRLYETRNNNGFVLELFCVCFYLDDGLFFFKYRYTIPTTFIAIKYIPETLRCSNVGNLHDRNLLFEKYFPHGVFTIRYVDINNHQASRYVFIVCNIIS